MPYAKSTYEYSKPRKTFGRQPLFSVVPAHIVDHIPEDKLMQKQYVLRNPVNREVQATLPQSEHDCNTKLTVMHDTSMNHEEGGWPREIHPDSEEMTHRHRRRVLHEENYIQAVFKLAPTITHYLNQNNAIEMYKSYFADMAPQESVEVCNVKIANTFRDPKAMPISSIVWTVESSTKLAVSHYAVDEQISDEESGASAARPEYYHSYIWDIHSESAPLHTLQHEHPCWRLAPSPVDPEVLIGGMENGIINVFDIRSGNKSVSCTSVYNSHFRPITGALFIHTRSNSEFFTCSPDGMCLWWDLRNLDEPTDRLPMSVRLEPKEKPCMSNAEGMSSIQYDRNMPTRFLGGTESGLVINANRMGKTHNEILTNYWDAHSGAVRAVHRSPCTSRMFITCGDFTVNIWSEEVRSAPIIFTNPYRFEIADVAWAPHRLSSYMCVCEGGVYYYWDLLRNCVSPSTTLQVSKHPLTKVTPHEEGELVAVGDKRGSMFLLRLADHMAVSGPRDKALMAKVYERETRREHILDNRIKEIHLKQRMEEEAAAAALEEEEKVEEELGDEEIEARTEEYYFSVVKKHLEELGITPE